MEEGESLIVSGPLWYPYAFEMKSLTHQDSVSG